MILYSISEWHEILKYSHLLAYKKLRCIFSRLTAFVLKSFAQASDYIFIDTNVIEKAAMMMISKQNQDGSFNNTGTVIMKSMQVILSSFVEALETQKYILAGA